MFKRCAMTYLIYTPQNLFVVKHEFVLRVTKCVMSECCGDILAELRDLA